MRKINSSIILAVVFTILTSIFFSATVEAASNKGNYVSTWYNGSVKCIDYYEYNNSIRGYTKTVKVRVKARKLYFKGSSRYLSTSLLSNDQVGLDANGNLYFITSNYKLWYVSKGSRSAQFLDYAQYLDFNDDDVVTSYKKYSGNNRNGSSSSNNRPVSASSYIEAGYDYNGNYYYLTSDHKLYFVRNGSRTAEFLDYAEYIDFDSSNHVISYKPRVNNNRNNSSNTNSNNDLRAYIRESYIESGYDANGNLYYITPEHKLYYIKKGTKTVEFIDYAEYLDYDRNNLVISYKIRNNNNNSNNNSNTRNSGPYISTYNQGNNVVTTFYEYNSSRREYVEYMHIQKSGSYLYVSNTQTWVTSTLLNNQYGFSSNGDIYFINSDYSLWYIQRGSYAKQINYAEYLDFDSNGFVASYKYKNNSGNNNNNRSYPYTTWDNSGNLIYVESNNQQQVLYYDGTLTLNNITLYRNNVSHYGFFKNGVIYITNDGSVIRYNFGEKRQSTVASNGISLNYNENGIVTGYNTYNGTYNI